MRIDLGLGIVPAALRSNASAESALPPGHTQVVRAGEPVVQRGETIITRAGG